MAPTPPNPPTPPAGGTPPPTGGGGSNRSQQAQEAAKLREQMVDVLRMTRDYADEAKNAAIALGKGTMAAEATKKAFKDVADLSKNIEVMVEDVVEGLVSFQDVQKQVLKTQQKRKSFDQEWIQTLNSANFTEQEREQIMSGQVSYAEILTQQGRDINKDMADLLDLYEHQNYSLMESEATMKELDIRALNMEKSFGLAGNSVGLMEGAINKMGGTGFTKALGIEDAIGKTKEFIATESDGGNKRVSQFKVAGNMAKNLGKNLMKSLSPWAIAAAAIQQLIEAFKFIDSSSGEIAKNQGISAREGQKMVAHANDIAIAQDDTLVSTKDILKANESLNKIMGSNVKWSGEVAAEFASIQERTGLSDEAMRAFTKQSQAAGTSIKDQLVNVEKVRLELNQQEGLTLSLKDLQEDIGKMTNAQKLTLGGTTEELARAAYRARQMGMELKDMEAIGGNLLDFESSIASEMEAELLTGRQLNLEKARSAALEGDYATVAGEVRKQVGSAAEFTKMNVIQQEALAKAIGMNRDQLADVLVQEEENQRMREFGFESISDAQKQYNEMVKSGIVDEELKQKLAEAGVLKQMESVTVAEKFGAIMEKIQDMFVKIMTPLMPIFDVLFQITEVILKEMISIIMEIVGEFQDLFKEMGFITGEAGEMKKVITVIGKILGVVIISSFRSIFLIIKKIKEQIDAVKMVFSGIGMILDGDIGGGIKKIGAGIFKWFVAPLNAALDVIEMIWDKIKEILNLFGADFETKATIKAKQEEEEGKTKETTPMAEGGYLIGEAGIEAVVPLNDKKEMNVDFEPLIKVIRDTTTETVNAIIKNKDVYMDGNKVGTQLSLSNPRMQ